MAATPYRVASPLPPDPYLVAWAKLRLREVDSRYTRVVFGVVFGAFCLITGCTNTSPVVLGMMLFPLAALMRARMLRFPCPRCGRAFVGWGREFSADLECRHCGVKFGTPAKEHRARGSDTTTTG
jgi:predicted RNA-binding Zn-ribbon protein involved in translation (DUF1610 family)